MPRPVAPIVAPGAPDELQSLVKASHQRRLSRAEDARLRALSWQPVADLERARLFLSRHPDLAGALLGQTREHLDLYEPGRQAALEAGVIVADPDERAVAEVDRLAAEVRATAADPYLDLDTRRRAAFGVAIRADWAAAIAEWTAWLAEHDERNAFARRRASVRLALGHATSADVRPAPRFVEELEAAVGGETVRSMLPIIPR